MVSVVGTIIAVGFLLWLAHTIIPMHQVVRKILDAVVICALVFWLLREFRVLH